ncbi:hypothetical protein B0H67DRAFT_558798 [Lasiosphaeris hirsuta]|uniref:Uncharacterized protein n=1 Tax=Lasiosphaeris hirsuta TaxID=260670 RepID=A0AA40DIF6_9PEZI|nr:hypothetical protein B0H67DRAFT_558798 [Lasiosphaeris hirsuta]
MVASTLWQSKTAAPMLPGGPLQPGPFRCGTKLGEAARFQQACRDLDTLRKNYRQSLESQISQLERELKGVRNQREKRTVSAARARKNRIRKSLSHLPAGLNLTLGGEAMSQQGGGASSHFVDRRGSVPAMMTDSPGTRRRRRVTRTALRLRGRVWSRQRGWLTASRVAGIAT